MSIETGSPSQEAMKAELEMNPRFKEVLEEESLKYVKEKNADWFFSEYSGEVSPQGYLLDKNGRETNFLPSQCVSVGYPEVLEAVKARLDSEA